VEGGGIPTTFIQTNGVLFGAADVATFSSSGLTHSAFADADANLAFTGVSISAFVDSVEMFDFVDAGMVQIRASSYGPARVQPIAPPATGQGNGEGGRISLAAYVGSMGLGVAGERESMAIAKAEPQRAAALEEPNVTSGRSISAEPLRTRAVIYEVARATQPATRRDGPVRPAELVAGINSSIANAAALTAAQTLGEQAAAPAAAAVSSESSAVAHRDPATNPREPAIMTSDTLRAVVTETAASARPLHRGALDRDDAEVVARDSAFAWWGGASDHAEEERQAMAPSDRAAYRMLGAAIAVSLAAGPVRKLFRRSVRSSDIEQRPPHRRLGAVESL
jgi:hypothetical protein